MENRIARFVDELVHDPAFLARYPYYAAILARLHPVEDPSVETMGLSLHHGRFYLHANVEALSREPRFVRGILLHEIHHLVLGHLTDPSYRAFEKKELGQVAMETSANEHVEEPLPTPILWQHFERFGFRAGQSTRERYELLCKAEAEAQRPMPRPGTDEVDDHSWSEQQLPPGATEHVRRLVVESVEEARERAEASAEKRAKLLAGKTPDRLLLELFGTSLPPEEPLDWKTALRTFVARVRTPVRVRHRPNRRFPERIFEVPGRSYQPRPIDRPKLVVAIDTSMSMTEAELLEVAKQLRGLAEHARLVIVHCDAAIAKTEPWDGTLSLVEGRGGTDLRPVFEPAFLAQHAADGVVYFTDGLGPFPEEPPRIPVLWILTKPNDFACPWGTRARLPRKAAPAPSKPSKARR
ncbi:MAG: VWA-like domain-containing protein [Polyangiales bacterium]